MYFICKFVNCQSQHHFARKKKKSYLDNQKNSKSKEKSELKMCIFMCAYLFVCLFVYVCVQFFNLDRRFYSIFVYTRLTLFNNFEMLCTIEIVYFLFDGVRKKDPTNIDVYFSYLIYFYHSIPLCLCDLWYFLYRFFFVVSFRFLFSIYFNHSSLPVLNLSIKLNYFTYNFFYSPYFSLLSYPIENSLENNDTDAEMS